MPGRSAQQRARALGRVLKKLSRQLGELSFGPPVTHVYDPLDYAWPAHSQFVERFAGRAKTVMLGMNPGPWGMVQTGVPFGDAELVREWIGLKAKVGKPANEHPKRQVQGLDCKRREGSGKRLWGWARERFGTPERFFARFYVLNYCPLCFMEESGRNRTPDKLPAAEREPLFAACDEALRKSVEILEPRTVIGIGQFAEARAKETLGDGVEILRILHPSPANPTANRGWAKIAEKQLAEAGIELP